ncbi:hypothetical protein FM037_14150 [Shewanella psychropiezotolerans]|uniref:Uncharacterized protein n=1 Tax=Shewanella psychropiezotolerans TaxID=2593655 RepID=A0ABX5WZB9_9GAMM|nr:hypothetical protein [Shewanella psychropiezotolerans]QDO84166.1 hypothetical protein FM037_14150 [Shewanella psychropiezotolerans]
MEKLPQEETGVRFKQAIDKPKKLIIIIYQFIARILGTMSGLLGRLTVAQKLYLLALFLLIFSDNFGMVAIVTVAALTLEFWPLFERVWHSLSGKAVLLLFYAVIANFAIAGAASVVNEVVGVSTEHFSYTHNFAILLYLPAWIIVMTALAILMLQVAVPFYLLCLLLLKPFGVTGLKLINHNHFRFTTMFIRLILSSVVLYHLMLITSLDDELSQDLSDPDGLVMNELSAQDKEELSNELTNLREKDKTDDASLTIGLSFNGSDAEKKEQVDNYENVREDYEKMVRSMIARFAYQLESDSRSRCAIAPGSNIVELNDYEIVEIRRDKAADYGYSFEVKKCISPAFGLDKAKPRAN